MGTIEYRELKNFDEFRECVSLQKRVFGVSDVDTISPLILTLFAKKFPPIGIVIGAIDKSTEKIIGFAFYTAVLQENALYGVASGVLQEYRDKNVGTNLNYKIRELALARNVRNMYGNYEPLEGNLGHTYFNKLGFWGIKYLETPYELTPEKKFIEDIPIDKIVFRWDLDSPRVADKMKGKFNKKKIDEARSIYPIVNANSFDDSNVVLVKIPGDFIEMKKNSFEDALNWRLNTRKIFNEYINNRGYWITEFYSQKKDGKRENYYLLEKK